MAMRDYHFTPESYLAMMREAVPGYDRLEDETVAATGVGARSVLELGTGTGETARRVLDRHPDAHLTGIDGSPGMVDVARENLPSDRVSLLVRGLEDPLPKGTFDLVVSALAVHHLEGADKADLFDRIARQLDPGAASFSQTSSSQSIPRMSSLRSTGRSIIQASSTSSSLGSKLRDCCRRSRGLSEISS